MIMDVTGPPLRMMMCSGTEILNRNAELFIRLTVIKNAVNMTHFLMGTVRFLRNNEPGPAEMDTTLGRVRSEVIANWVKVISAPITCWSIDLARIGPSMVLTSMWHVPSELKSIVSVQLSFSFASNLDSRNDRLERKNLYIKFNISLLSHVLLCLPLESTHVCTTSSKYQGQHEGYIDPCRNSSMCNRCCNSMCPVSALMSFRF